ncbi:MAG: hypothetical protein AABY32_04795 [Nanoarchaeota archaeon]
MNFEYSPAYCEEKNYIITYKGIDGKEHMTSGDATSKSDAERQFRNSFNPHCEIIKTQTSDEWVDDTSTEIVNGLMKHIKKDIKNLFNNSKKIDYNSKSFLKGLRKITEEVEKSREMSIPDYEKKYLSYNI